jgi:hypothetical protein
MIVETKRMSKYLQREEPCVIKQGDMDIELPLKVGQ